MAISVTLLGSALLPTSTRLDPKIYQIEVQPNDPSTFYPTADFNPVAPPPPKPSPIIDPIRYPVNELYPTTQPSPYPAGGLIPEPGAVVPSDMQPYTPATPLEPLPAPQPPVVQPPIPTPQIPTPPTPAPIEQPTSGPRVEPSVQMEPTVPVLPAPQVIGLTRNGKIAIGLGILAAIGLGAHAYAKRHR